MSASVVDILMATYNGGRHVAQQITSLQGQTERGWRLLVSDDCSADDTLAVVERAALADPRIQVVSRGVRHGGAKENFFSLLPHAQAPYVAFCDQDDVWLPRKLELTLDCARRLEREAGPGMPVLAMADMRVVDESLGLLAESFWAHMGLDPARTGLCQVAAQSLGAGCTMVCNAELVRLMREPADLRDVVMHDWWATLIAAAFGRIGHVGEPLSLYRQHGANTLGAQAATVSRFAGRFSEMAERVAANARQARAFLGIFGPRLSEADRVRLERFAAVADSWGPAALLGLARSGCWKSGLRAAGQALGAMGKVAS